MLDTFLTARQGVAVPHFGVNLSMLPPLRAQFGIIRLGTDEDASHAVGLPLHREAVETETQRLPQGVVILHLHPIPLRQIDGLEGFALAVASREEEHQEHDP